MTTAKIALAFALVVSLHSPAFAAGPKIADSSIAAGDRSNVVVTFEVPQPESRQVTEPGQWLVLLSTADRLEQRTVTAATVDSCVKGTAVQGNACPGDTVAVLKLTIAAAPAGLKAIEVVYSGPLGPATQTTKLTENAGSIITGGKKDDADIFLSGTYIRASGEDPKYSLDTYAGYVYALPAYQLGVYGLAKTDKAADLDPQSFLFYAFARRSIGSGAFHGPFQGAIGNARAGMEFDADGKQQNFVLSPTVVVPFRVSRGRLGLVQPGFTTPHGTLVTGVELVKPVSSELDDESWRARLLLGSTFTAGWKPEKPWIFGAVVKALYEVRFLTGDEPFTDPRHTPRKADGKKDDAILEFGDAPRPHAEVSFSYLFAEWAGIEAKYEYGSLPPAFVITDHKGTVGVTLALKQTSYARYSILKP